MKKRAMQITAVLAAGTMLLGGCGNKGNAEGDGAGTESGSGTTEISFIHWGGDGTFKECYEERIAAFEEANPDIKVKVTTIADKYETKLQTMIAGKQAPDVMQVAENGMGFASKGAFIDLSEKVEEAGIDTEANWGNVTEQYTYDGQLFGVPDRGGCTVIYYNKDLFDDANLEYPSEEWTWDDFYTAAEALTKDTDGDGEIDQWGAATTHYQGAWGCILQAFGGNVIKDGEVAINSKENQETMTRYNEAYQNGWIVSYEELEKANTGGDAYFSQGKLGMNITGLWGIQGCAEAEELNFDIAPVPKGTQESGWPTGSALAISSQSSEEKQEAAWKFVQYMTSEDAQQILGKDLPDCPANLNVLSSEEFINQQLYGKSIDMQCISTAMSRATVDGVLRGPYYQECIDECRTQIQEMLLGRLTTTECLELLDTKLNDILEQY